jgi:hypothetical protein
MKRFIDAGALRFECVDDLTHDSISPIYSRFEDAEQQVLDLVSCNQWKRLEHLVRGSREVPKPNFPLSLG